MSKQTASSNFTKRPWHTPRLYTIRGQDTAQTKILHASEGNKRRGIEHITGSGIFHGPGAVGPS